MLPNTFPVILEEAYMITPNVKHFIIRSHLTPTFNYLPGQFITLHFLHNDKILRRSYSIANVPAADNRIEFAAGYVEHGPGTEYLFNLKPGDTIHISGPFGRLVLKDEVPGRYIFVATSTGITPYRSMLKELKRRLDANPQLNIVILEGVQQREDLLYRDEFFDFIRQNPRTIFRAHLSREAAVIKDEHEYNGYVQSAFRELALDPLQDMVYLCGNPGMIDDAFAYLKELGFTPHNIIREKYISSK
jgi:ferredoxin-NADP reductase